MNFAAKAEDALAIMSEILFDILLTCGIYILMCYEYCTNNLLLGYLRLLLKLANVIPLHFATLLRHLN